MNTKHNIKGVILVKMGGGIFQDLAMATIVKIKVVIQVKLLLFLMK